MCASVPSVIVVKASVFHLVSSPAGGDTGVSLWRSRSLRGISIIAHLVGTHRLLMSDGGGSGSGGLFNQPPAVNRFGVLPRSCKKKKKRKKAPFRANAE